MSTKRSSEGEEERGAGGRGEKRASRRRPPGSSSWALSAFLYTRGLALVAACAFVSLWIQVEGLYGDRGLTPVRSLFEALGGRSDVGFLDLPTLVWLEGSPTMLAGLCAVGTAAAGLLFLGILPSTALLVAWASYLSLVNAGMPWTSFQWDLLLVEVLLASTLFVPTARLDRFDPRQEPSIAGRWLVWLLLFRLMFRSGFVKLASGDPTWADLTALEYHYFTQPLPTVLGWYAAHLPGWLDRISCALVFVVELGLPFLVFVPFRWARRTAATGFAGLMLLVALTGSYGFFNLLALVLAGTLVDDDAWRWLLPRRVLAWIEGRGRGRVSKGAGSAPPDEERVVRERAMGLEIGATADRLRSGLAVGLAALGMLGFASGLAQRGVDPIAWLRPFRSLNDYGLFAVMTTRRPEIEIAGSMDGGSWTPYVFRYKVGPLDRAPVWAAPHQPRLDWQMWFAALGSVQGNPWLERLMDRLLANEPAVLGLLAGNPFPDAPPRFVSATLYDYRPTTLEERAQTGEWWHREPIGPYAPTVMRAGD